ncbi:MAG: hypothetical protein IJK12_03785 [Clostridia bacterium]|nr:hypothetical protein [Clostridia bacterium]
MVTIPILVILGLCVLAGYYRGVIYSAISIGLTILSFFLALLLIPAVAAPVRESNTLYGGLLYYFEGYEYVNRTSVEMIHDPAAALDDEQLNTVIRNAEMPIPFGRAVKKNIRNEVYRDSGISTLGDYFNQTIVDVVLNILSLLVLFVGIRIFLGFILRMVDYGRRGLPALKRYDAVFSCGIGFLHGVVLLSIFFMLVPILLVIVPRLGVMIIKTPLGGFFYRMNPFVLMIPTT